MGFTLLSEMPSFLTDELGFGLSSAGVMCVFPYLGLFITTLGFGKFFLYMQVRCCAHDLYNLILRVVL